MRRVRALRRPSPARFGPSGPAPQGSGARRRALLDGVREHVLDNGLRVLIKPVPTIPIVSVWCWYAVGSANERPGLTGAAHWVEHMNFKGTEGITMEEMKGLIEEQGGYWNGYTWLDVTTYFETLASDALEVALRLESERMHRCLYDPDEVQSERTVILSELQGGENDPTGLLDKEVTAAAFRAHPYGWPTIGHRCDLETMTRDDLWSFYRNYYVPNNATLVVAGAVDAAVALEGAVRHFGSIPPGPEPRRVGSVEPPQFGERRVVVERPGRTAYVRASYHAPTPTDDLFCPLLLCDAVLSGAKGINLWSGAGGAVRRSSYLYRKLVETGLAAGVWTSLPPTRDPFLYSILVTVREGVPPEEAEQALLAALDEFHGTDLAETELPKVMNQARARFVFESASVTEMGHQLGYFATIADHRILGSFEERIAAVSSEAVRESARTVLARWNRTVGVFRPLPDDEARGSAAEGEGR